MTKIRILTLKNADNCGTFLQTCSLKTTLQKQGCSASVFCLSPKLEQGYKIVKWSKSSSKNIQDRDFLLRSNELMFSGYFLC